MVNRVRKLPPKVRRQLAHRYAQGETSFALTKIYGVSVPTVLKCVKENGVAVRPPGGPPMTAARQAARELRAAGLSYEDISRELGISPLSIYRWLTP